MYKRQGEVLFGLLVDDIDSVVYCDYTDKTVFFVNNRQSKEIVVIENITDNLFIFNRRNRCV